MLISESALDSDQGQRIVYVVGQNNKVEARTVQLGDLHEGLRAVESGVQAGDRIVVNGLQQVRTGITVEAKLVAMPGSAENRKASVAKSTTESQASETKRGAS